MIVLVIIIIIIIINIIIMIVPTVMAHIILVDVLALSGGAAVTAGATQNTAQ